jgi:hypothetical protein
MMLCVPLEFACCVACDRARAGRAARSDAAVNRFDACSHAFHWHAPRCRGILGTARARLLEPRIEDVRTTEEGCVYAVLTTTKGSTEDMLETAAVVGEAMFSWLSEIDGWQGLLMLVNDETGVTQVISLWESKELAERHTHARLQFRDRITATVDVEVQETVGYEVGFAQLRGL